MRTKLLSVADSTLYVSFGMEVGNLKIMGRPPYLNFRAGHRLSYICTTRMEKSHTEVCGFYLNRLDQHV